MVNRNFILVLTLLLISSFVLAAPAVTSVSPTAGQGLQCGNNTLTFTLKDENPDANWTNKLLIYYSATSGTYSSLIVTDTNIADGTTVDCAVSDNNLLVARTCTYTWNIPCTTSTGTYYIDYNFIPNSENANVGYKVSSSSFRIQQYTNSTCGLINLIALVLIAVALVFFLYQGYMLSQGEFQVLQTVIGAILFLIIFSLIGIFNASLCVIV